MIRMGGRKREKVNEMVNKDVLGVEKEVCGLRRRKMRRERKRRRGSSKRGGG